MADPSTSRIVRTDPNLKTLQKRVKREKDGEMVRRMQAIIIMLLFDDITQVLRIMDISKDTLLRWIRRFNEEGLQGLAKKNDPDAPPS